jgi:RHS repeat-associated protein
LGAGHKLKRQYVTMAGMPVAVIDEQGQGSSKPSAWSQGASDVLHLVKQVFSQQGIMAKQTITWLHLNHLGAPEAATDTSGAVVWKVRYASSGAATELQASSLDIKLRLPGQYADSETGLHYNRHRYYDPARGQFLTPDPMASKPGYPDGPNPYAYVRYNPIRYVDPSGLVLFAFDGTGNSDDKSDPAMAFGGGSEHSNVWNLYEGYDQTANGGKYYVSGVGTVDRDRYNLGLGEIRPEQHANWSTALRWLQPTAPAWAVDFGGNYSGRARIQRMMTYFENAELNTLDTTVMNIDITGFSRGAAQARDFANRIQARSRSRTEGGVSYMTNGLTEVRANDGSTQQYFMFTTLTRDSVNRITGVSYRCQRINMRFMGLFDTVLSVDMPSGDYNMVIPSSFRYVAHAVALNEHRSSNPFNFWQRNPIALRQHYGGFPLVSIGRSGGDLQSDVRVEMGFIGAHADIGGGYGAGDDYLSRVPLHWMYAQAQIAGLSMNVAPAAIESNNVILHDQSNGMRIGDPRNPVELHQTFDENGRSVSTEYNAEDRVIEGAVSGRTQRTMSFGNRSMRNADTYAHLTYRNRDPNNHDPRSSSSYRSLRNSTATVNVESYREMLRSRGYCMYGEACANQRQNAVRR